MNLSELLADSATRFGDSDFLLFERQPNDAAGEGSFRQSLSFGKLDSQVNRACHYISEV